MVLVLVELVNQVEVFLAELQINLKEDCALALSTTKQKYSIRRLIFLLENEGVPEDAPTHYGITQRSLKDKLSQIWPNLQKIRVFELIWEHFLENFANFEKDRTPRICLIVVAWCLQVVEIFEGDQFLEGRKVWTFTVEAKVDVLLRKDHFNFDFATIELCWLS